MKEKDLPIDRSKHVIYGLLISVKKGKPNEEKDLGSVRADL